MAVTFFSEGTAPRRLDTTWKVLVKILGATLDGGGSGSAQMYTGAAPPAAPADPTQAAIFYPDGGGTQLQWDVVSQAWV